MYDCVTLSRALMPRDGHLQKPDYTDENVLLRDSLGNLQQEGRPPLNKESSRRISPERLTSSLYSKAPPPPHRSSHLSSLRRMTCASWSDSSHIPRPQRKLFAALFIRSSAAEE